MKIYIDMEPQPEPVELIYDYEFAWWVKRITSEVFIPPYRPGDVLDLPIASGPMHINLRDEELDKFYTVKAVSPIQRDGRWKWEVELE